MRKKGGKAAAATTTSPPAAAGAAAPGDDAEAPPPPLPHPPPSPPLSSLPMSRTSTTDSQKEARALSSIEAVSDGGGQFVDSALDASRFAAPRGGGGGKGTGDTGGEGSTLPPGEGSILPGEGSKTTSVISGIDFGSLKNRIASAIDHAVHPQDGSETYEFFFLRRKVLAKKKNSKLISTFFPRKTNEKTARSPRGSIGGSRRARCGCRA